MRQLKWTTNFLVVLLLAFAACKKKSDPQPAPTITGFSPTSALVGASVTITGANFADNAAGNIVSFNGTRATVTAASTTSLTVTVPVGATTGKITVQVGSLIATSSIDFEITSFTQKANFGRAEGIILGVSFSIGNKAYVGLGKDNTMLDKTDFWEYDLATNVWTQKANFPGSARRQAVSFTIGNKGYVGTGFSTEDLKDFWEYDPATNAWTQKADVGGQVRSYAMGFAIGNKGYIGGGYGPNGTMLQDFWEYNPTTNTWTQKANLGSGEKAQGFTFATAEKGYIGAGYTQGATAMNDLWEYTPDTNTWTRKADFLGLSRFGFASFAISNKGYVCLGGAPGNGEELIYQREIWEYDTTNNTWLRKTDFPNIGRSDVFGFAIGNKGYLGGGFNGNNYYRDFFEFTP
jgi:N-acetylneuraminic acid mutarotase